MRTSVTRYRLRRLCAFIIGLVFLLAGIFKLLDPAGAGLVVEEYYRFLGLTFMLPTAKVAGVSQWSVEKNRRYRDQYPAYPVHYTDSFPGHIQSFDGLRLLRRGYPFVESGHLP